MENLQVLGCKARKYCVVASQNTIFQKRIWLWELFLIYEIMLTGNLEQSQTKNENVYDKFIKLH